MEKVNIINEIRAAASELRDGKLKNLDRLAPTLEKIRVALGLDTTDEVIIFVPVFDRQCSSEDTMVRDLAFYFDCAILDVVTHYDAIMSLVDKNLLVVKNRFASQIAKNEFSLEAGIFKAIVEGRDLPAHNRPADVNNDRFTFCHNVDEMIQARWKEDLDPLRLMTDVERLEEMNMGLPFVKDVVTLVPNLEDRVLFYKICSDYKSADDSISIDETMDKIYDCMQDQLRVKIAIADGTHSLIAEGLSEVQGEDRLTLSYKGVKLYFNEFASLYKNKYTGLDRYTFLSCIREEFDKISLWHRNTGDIYNVISKMEEWNPQLNMIGKLTNMVPYRMDRAIFYMVCCSMVAHEKFFINDLSKLLDPSNETKTKRELINKSHQLQKTDLITVNKSNYMESATIELTRKGKELFLEEDIDLFEDRLAGENIIQSDRIPEKRLFFDGALERQLTSLRNYLQEDRYSLICERLKQNNQPMGMAVLLYGDPGTGKTESVMQIARATGRSIVHVDISATKTCWFGESERLIKRVFADYRRICERGELKPILLFNEADAVLSKRKDSNMSNVAQTENAIQNILLEEIENLDGILIATTNMLDNLDPAFDRRFLFKIHFGKPTEQARAGIWQDKIPALSEEEALQLAEAYDFSGGEIDNVARKAAIEEVLSGTAPTVDSLKVICSEERILTQSARKIGFNSK